MKIPILTFLTCVAALAAPASYVTQDSQGNVRLNGNIYADNFMGRLSTTLSGTSWEVDLNNYAYRAVVTGDTTMTFSNGTSSNAWQTTVLMIGNGTNTLTLSGANIVTLGGAPDIVPAGIQKLFVVPLGGTNYVHAAWRPISGISGFMKQSDQGPTIDPNDYASITTSLQTQINDIIAGGTGGSTIMRIGGHTGVTWADASTYYLGGDIAGATGTLTYTNQAVKMLKAGTITSVFLKVRCATAASSESVSFYLDINNGAISVPLSTTVSMAALVNDITVTGLSQSVSVGDYLAIRIQTPTWVTDPTTDRCTAFVRLDN